MNSNNLLPSLTNHEHVLLERLYMLRDIEQAYVSGDRAFQTLAMTGLVERCTESVPDTNLSFIGWRITLLGELVYDQAEEDDGAAGLSDA